MSDTPSVGNGSETYSTDGISWVNANATHGFMQAVAYGDRRFFAVGRDGKASYSADGTVWRASNHNKGELYKIAFSD